MRPFAANLGMLLLVAGHLAPLAGDEKRPSAEPREEQVVEPYDSETKGGAIEVGVDDKEPRDSFDVLQDGQRAFEGAPRLLNSTLELPPGAYVVEVNWLLF